eukprot:2711562-Rhodomonas_salina.2
MKLLQTSGLRIPTASTGTPVPGYRCSTTIHPMVGVRTKTVNPDARGQCPHRLCAQLPASCVTLRAGDKKSCCVK